jgi:hypothetical protein
MTDVRAMNDYRSTIIRWLCRHGYSNLDINFAEDFGYSFDDYYNGIDIGVEAISDNVAKYFEQFLVEYGLKYINIPAPVLCFLHELFHFVTLSAFTDEELWLCNFSKSFDHNESEFEAYYRYWLMPDEFSANAALIDYVNEHIDEVEDLCNVMSAAWAKLINVIKNPFDLIPGEEKNDVT